jgi:hypothetical protein
MRVCRAESIVVLYFPAPTQGRERSRFALPRRFQSSRQTTGGSGAPAGCRYRSPRTNVPFKIAASRANSTSTVCPGRKSLNASAKALRFDVLIPPRASNRSPGLRPAFSAPDPGCMLPMRTPSPWSVMSGTMPVAALRAATGVAGSRDCATGAWPEKLMGSGREVRY